VHYVVMQEVDFVIDSVEKLGGLLEVKPQVTQTLVTKDPRCVTLSLSYYAGANAHWDSHS
jgi:hypothetical protein